MIERGRGERGDIQLCSDSDSDSDKKDQVYRSCGPQITSHQENSKREILYSTCASPVVPHPSTGHAHGCLASEIGRDPAFPTRYDRTVDSPEVSLLTPSRQRFGAGKGLSRERDTREW
jgi:hypothetical protein